MSLMSLLPSAFKELLSHVPTLLFEVISWRSLAHDIKVLSTRLLTGEGAIELAQKIAPHLPEHIKIHPHDSKLTLAQEDGAHILELYFRQLFNKEGMFLDLRLKHFSKSNKQIHWSPGHLWSNFSPSFQEGLASLYDGFYYQEDNLFRQGLLQTGLISSTWSIEDQREMERLFKAHFGDTLKVPMSFNLKTFQDSFHNVFDFLMKKKVKLSTDFLILGVMLVTLYLNLEELGGSYPVAEIYKKVRPR
jgi:hypothetical protein